MSMLAEPRRKQKWSLNPRGKHWAEDSSKFGQKMLEKMGWSQGKGLGAKEDGIVDHIKVSHKNDSKGIGYKESDDQWTEHESNFSALLEALGGGEKETDEIKLNSLEEKSQSSRARVHYRKFTRGKDLSRYSEKDLANIFGKKSLKELKKAKKQQETLDKQASEDQQGKEEDEKSTFFSNAGLISDYFKKKLPNFGMGNGLVVGNNGVLKKYDNSDSESEMRPSFGFGFTQKTNKEESFENKEPHNTTFAVSKEDSIIKSTFTSFNYGTDSVQTPESKKNKKKRNMDDETNEETPSKKKKLAASEVHEDTPVKKKKDKSKKKQHIEEQNGLMNPAFDPMYSPPKLQKHVLEPIEESINETLNGTLNDTVGQVAESFEVRVQINNETTPVRKEGKDDEDDTTKKKKKKKGKTEDMDLSFQQDESRDQTINETKKKKKKKLKNIEDSEVMETSISNISETSNLDQNSIDSANSTGKKNKKIRSIEIINTEEEKKKSKKKTKSKNSQEGVDNPFFNMSIESEESMASQSENPYEVTIKEKKKKKKRKEENENCGMENPVFNGEDSLNSQDIVNEEFEVKRKDKSKKKKKAKKEKEESNGLDNPALNLNDTIEESCDLMLNIVTTPVMTKVQRSTFDESSSIQKVNSIKRRKSVRFSDVTRERIIPNKEEVEQDTLDESRDIVEVEGKLNDSSDLTYIDKFILKKKAKKRKQGLDNSAFDKQTNSIEENITSMSNTLDTYQAEIENDMNEAKLKSVEIEDIMVGEVGNPDGTSEILPDGRVKLKFKDAKFNKSARYLDGLTGAKKSYKHLIKGDIIMNFKETNLHEIEGYAVKAS